MGAPRRDWAICCRCCWWSVFVASGVLARDVRTAVRFDGDRRSRRRHRVAPEPPAGHRVRRGHHWIPVRDAARFHARAGQPAAADGAEASGDSAGVLVGAAVSAEEAASAAAAAVSAAAAPREAGNAHRTLTPPSRRDALAHPHAVSGKHSRCHRRGDSPGREFACRGDTLCRRNVADAAAYSRRGGLSRPGARGVRALARLGYRIQQWRAGLRADGRSQRGNRRRSRLQGPGQPGRMGRRCAG